MNVLSEKMQDMNMKTRMTVKYMIGCMALCLAACSGNVDPEENDAPVVLEADKTEVVADGSSQVSFKVWHGNEDVTGTAVIACTSGGGTVSDAKFLPQTAGTYVFEASYDGRKSDPLEVTAVAPEVEESRFQRHVCVMEFTGTKCAQCPEGATTISYLVNHAYKGKMFVLAFHNTEEDPYHVAEELELKKIYKFSTYPSYLTDMRAEDCGELNKNTGCSSSIEKSLYDTQTHCGAAVACSYDEASATVTVTAKVYSEKTMNYRMAAYVVEDNVKGKQLLATGTVQEDYTHHHMVRKMLSADVRGDALGQIASEKEVEKVYTFKVDPSWNIENLSVAVLAIDKDTHVNNMASCSALNGIMDYEMNK